MTGRGDATRVMPAHRVEIPESSGRSKLCVRAAIAILGLFAAYSAFQWIGATIKVQVDQPDARVEVDGVDRGQGNVTVKRLPYGKRVVTAVREGYRTASEEVVLVAPLPKTIELKMEAAAPQAVELTLRTKPGAAIYIDGREVGKAGADGLFRKTDMTAGQFRVEARLEGHEAWQDTVTVAPPRVWREAPLVEPVAANTGSTSGQARPPASQADPQRAAEFVRQADRNFKAQQYQAALAAANQALLLDPRNAQARKLRDEVTEVLKILNSQ